MLFFFLFQCLSSHGGSLPLWFLSVLNLQICLWTQCMLTFGIQMNKDNGICELAWYPKSLTICVQEEMSRFCRIFSWQVRIAPYCIYWLLIIIVGICIEPFTILCITDYGCCLLSSLYIIVWWTKLKENQLKTEKLEILKIHYVSCPQG